MQLSQHAVGFRSIQHRRQDDRFVNLQFGVRAETAAIPDCALRTTEGLADFGNPAGHFVVDLDGAGEIAAQVGETAHDLQLGAFHGDLRCDVCSVGQRLMHNHRFFRVSDKAEIVAGGVEERLMDGRSGYTRFDVHPSTIAEVAVRPVTHADSKVFVMVDVNQHDRKHETEEGGSEDAAVLHSVGHCECLKDYSIVRDSHYHAIMDLTHYLGESLEAAELLNK
nr:unnamed protein product [Spirometra erinaceieuropaei]